MTLQQFYRLPEAEQEQQVEAWLLENAPTCPQCGGAAEECRQPEKRWYPQRTICYATMERAAAEWRYDQLHQDPESPYHDGSFKNWSEKRTVEAPYHYGDGVNIWVAPVDLAPDDDFLRTPQEAVCEPPEASDPNEGAR